MIKMKKIKKENIKINILNSPFSSMTKMSPIVTKFKGSPKDKDWKKKKVALQMLNTTIITKK
jgi:hypothetical protein